MENNEMKKMQYKMQTLSDIKEVLMKIHVGNNDNLLKDLIEAYSKIENDYINGVATIEEIDKAIEEKSRKKF